MIFACLLHAELLTSIGLTTAMLGYAVGVRMLRHVRRTA
jgi:hypothetical protein